MEKGSFISRKESTIIQGIAVLFMVYHHLFGFPERIDVEYYILSDFDFLNIGTILSYFGRICISLFSFVSAYGMYKKLNSIYDGKKNKIIKQGYLTIVKQAKNFFLRYWMVFIVFIPLGYILNVYEFDWIVFIKSLFGLSNAYNGEWWYVKSYLSFLFIFPLLFFVDKLISEKLGKKILSLFYIVFFIACTVLLLCGYELSVTILYFISGLACVSTDIFDAIYKFTCKIGKTKYVLVSIVTGVVCLIRFCFSDGCKYDYIYSPIIIFGICFIIKSSICKKSVNKVVGYIGKYSTYIWLTHTFFAYYYFQEYLYWFKYSPLIFVICILCGIVVGIADELIINKVNFLFSKLSMKLQRKG